MLSQPDIRKEFGKLWKKRNKHKRPRQRYPKSSRVFRNDYPDPGDELKKIPIEKKKFIMEKNDFENVDFQKNLKYIF